MLSGESTLSIYFVPAKLQNQLAQTAVPLDVAFPPVMVCLRRLPKFLYNRHETNSSQSHSSTRRSWICISKEKPNCKTSTITASSIYFLRLDARFVRKYVCTLSLCVLGRWVARLALGYERGSRCCQCPAEGGAESIHGEGARLGVVGKQMDAISQATEESNLAQG